MAQKFEQDLFFDEICEAAKNKKCFKSLLESLCDSQESLFMQKFTEFCKNLGKKLEEFEFEESKQQAQSGKDTSIRDEILYNLNVLREVFSCTELQSVCPLFFELLRRISREDGRLLIILKNCLKTFHDHFIAFQSYKLLCEVYKCFPNLVISVSFGELINMSLQDGDETCGQWLPVYTAEIIKHVFVDLENCDEVSNLCESTSESQPVCDCEIDKKNSNEICVRDIKHALCCHWLKLTNHYLAKLLTTLKDENSQTIDACRSTLNSCQQILVTMLSCGKTVFKSCDFVSANQKLPDMDTEAEITVQQFSKNRMINVDCEDMDLSTSETSKSAKRARTSENESLSTSNSKCHDSIYKGDSIAQPTRGDNITYTYDCEQKLFENIITQMVKINHAKCMLHFSRTVFQFLRDIIDVISEHCFDKEKTNFSQSIIRKSAGICSILMESSKILMENIPQVTGSVYFGGQDTSVKQGDLDVTNGQSYDKVSLRKVLLLVLKVMLVTLQTQCEFSKIEPWHVLELPLENWLDFVKKISSHSGLQSPAVWLVQLFTEQDDDLVNLLFCLLQLYQKLFHNGSSQTIPSWVNHLQNPLNPHGFFVEFLTSVNYDHSLLLDFLISNETHFLPYFHMYLRHLANDWYGFINTVEQREAQQLSKTIKPLSNDGGEDSVGDDGELSVDDDSNGGVGEDGGSDGNMSKVDVGCDGDMGDDDCESSDGVDGDMVDVNGNGDMGDVVGDGGNGDDDGENDDVDIGNGDGDSNGDSIGTDDDDSGDDGVNIDIGRYIGDGINIDIGIDGDVDDETYNDGNVDGDDHDVDFSNDIVGDSFCANDGNIDNVVLCSITLQQTLTCLIRLRYAVERMSSKGLFPYPVIPLVKLMKYIETLYEGQQ